ncbi:hypothetical protein F5Y02DRAFT_431034 [Annulohypoxylon stygium]|nr:hypothetical protein F5Y02DRAFT_431034 [Annulohypoxylon stygium]
MSLLRTDELSREFYGKVNDTLKVVRNRGKESSYDDLPFQKDSHDYTMRLKDELHMANIIAFFAQTQEGVGAISGVCIEEDDDRLIIRLASNETPLHTTVDGLRRVLDNVENGLKDDMSKSALEDLIFESVIDLNQDRILQRIRPNWISTPDYFRKGKLERNIELPLWERIRAILHRPECHPRLRRGLNKVISELQLLKRLPSLATTTTTFVGE